MIRVFSFRPQVFLRLYLSCYEKVKGEISLFRDIVDLLKVLSTFLCFLIVFSCLSVLGMSAVVGE
ncbi:MAG: hypothetical protein J6Y92_09630, partial [Lentisphaeria bacterium]|nr:hypothetical protein [Lentisphaeria bacterium]